jgi:hypothetical protein
MGWAKHEDAISHVLSSYNKGRDSLEAITHGKKLLSPEEIAKSADDYLVACGVVGRAVDDDLVEACLLSISHVVTTFSWDIKR